MPDSRYLVGLLVLLPMVMSCSSESPTEPPRFVREAATPQALAGQWSATTSFQPPGEDWSTIHLTIVSDERGVRGELVTRDGIRHSVVADMAPGGIVANLVIGELPQSPSCTHIQFSGLVIEKSGTTSALVVNLAGRCPSTLSQQIRFVRA